MYILVVNAGSSSVKYQLFDMTRKQLLARGQCERIGIDGRIKHTPTDQESYVANIPMHTHTEAIQAMIAALTDKDHGVIRDMHQIDAIGHRIVHGGPYFLESTLVTDEVLRQLDLCVELAPLHIPAHLMGIRGCMEAMPGTPQVVVFDTAYHQTMPREAYFYPIPYELYEKYKIRRYGFHGTSHRYVSAQAIDLLEIALGIRREDSKVVTCHLGNGSSITAVKGGLSVDTSMGFTPLEGLIMGTRTGSIDPAIIPFLMEKENISANDMGAWMNKNCGIEGVSQVSSDMREIDAAIAQGNDKAKLAHDILCYQIKKYIGSYAAAMGGLDAVVFTAGIGENNDSVRSDSLRGLEFLGIICDERRNRGLHAEKPTLISTSESKVRVWVIPTNEELVIASDTMRIVGKL